MLIPKDRFPISDVLLYGFLPGFLKKLIYRLKGYKIGKGVSIGLGAVICGKDVNIGKETSIGFLTIIRGKTIRIGSHVEIGATTVLDTPHLEIGDGSRINEQVFVGGLQFPDSKLVLGRNCQIMQMSFINPATSITVGDDSGIGGHSLLFGHTSWLSQFEGYNVNFKPIVIGSNVSIAWRVFLLPGTKIGDGAVVGANSLVSREIPPRCMAVGFPARVVQKYPDNPRDVTDEEKVDMLRNIITEMIAFFNGSGLECSGAGQTFEITTVKKRLFGSRRKTWQLDVSDKPASGEDLLPAGSPDVFLSLWKIPEKSRSELNARRTMWIDIESKERPDAGNDLGEEVALYFKRYGVRLFRV